MQSLWRSPNWYHWGITGMVYGTNITWSTNVAVNNERPATTIIIVRYRSTGVVGELPRRGHVKVVKVCNRYRLSSYTNVVEVHAFNLLIVCHAYHRSMGHNRHGEQSHRHY